MDLAGAYGKPGLRRLTRRFDFDGASALVLRDEFEFGPDGADLDLRASFGMPGGAELALGLGYREQGSITLVGYGDGSDYAHQSDFARDGLVYVKAGQSAERRYRVGLDASSPDWRAGAARISATGSIVATWASSYGCVPGDNRFWLDGSLSLSVGL